MPDAECFRSGRSVSRPPRYAERNMTVETSFPGERSGDGRDVASRLADEVGGA